MTSLLDRDWLLLKQRVQERTTHPPDNSSNNNTQSDMITTCSDDIVNDFSKLLIHSSYCSQYPWQESTCVVIVTNLPFLKVQHS